MSEPIEYHWVVVSCNKCQIQFDVPIRSNAEREFGKCQCGGDFSCKTKRTNTVKRIIIAAIALAVVALVIWLNYVNITTPDEQCMFDATADVERCAKAAKLP